MATVRYPYALPAYDLDQMQGELSALALPGYLGLCASGATVEALFAAALSDADQSRLAAAVAAHAPNPQAAIERVRGQAGADILSGATPVHVSARGADAAVWTYGVNHLLEYFTARFALAAGGNWSPTVTEVAAQIANARTTAAGLVDPDAPAPADVAALMMDRGRLAQADIVGLTQQLVEAGGGDPITQ